MIFPSLKNVKYQVQVIAPAGATPVDTLQKIKKALPAHFHFCPLDYKSWFFHSNSDEKRAEEVLKALKGPAKLILALRGGYGCARLFDRIASVLPSLKTPKVLVGYSDITALHLFLQNLGWPTVHGPILLEAFSSHKSPKNMQFLEEILSGRKKEISYSNVKALNSAAKNVSEVQGPLTGGNLTLVENSLATQWEIQTKDRILILEDVNVLAYQLDRSLVHLVQAGVFKKAKALILGSFSPASPEVATTLNRFAESLEIPVFKCEFIGHGVENYPVVFNEVAIIKKKKSVMTRALSQFSPDANLFSFSQNVERLQNVLGL